MIPAAGARRFPNSGGSFDGYIEPRAGRIYAPPDPTEYFKGKRYLPLGLIEAGRRASSICYFCVIQTYFKSTQNRR